MGYRVGSFGVSLTGGIPPEVKIEGAGSLSPLGALGRLRYGPTTLTVHYHFNPSGRFRPYVGAGPVFPVIFEDHDGAVQQLNVHANTGVVLQAGAEFATSAHWGLFFDAKKALLRTNASAVRGLSSSGTENLHKLAVTPHRHRIARIQAKQGGPQHRLGGMPAGGEPERSRGRSAQLAKRI